MKDYKKLVGMTKNEILLELGDHFNFFQADVWSYVLKNNWFGMKTVLFIFFENEKVTFVKIKKAFFHR